MHNGCIDLNAREVFFVGNNAQGKTAFLESLYYSAYGSSFRTRNDDEVSRHGSKGFCVDAMYEYASLTERITLSTNGGEKQIKKNGKKIHDRRELISTMSCVLFCHGDMRFADGTPEDRRFFLNQSLAMTDPLFLDDLHKYNRVLKSRNALLKNGQYGMLDIYDVQLSECGLEIQKKRRNIVFQFNQIFGQLYNQISGIAGITMQYRPSWKKDNASDIILQLKAHREQDKVMNTTLSGPHRDRLEFLIEGKPFVPVASMGQLRLIALLLRVSQAYCASNATGKKGVLLMDDVMLEIDTDKRQALTSMLPDYDQLFCTFLPDEPYQKYKKQSTMVYQIKDGDWTKIG